jgi:hypothetical protein
MDDMEDAIDDLLCNGAGEQLDPAYFNIVGIMRAKHGFAGARDLLSAMSWQALRSMPTPSTLIN